MVLGGGKSADQPLAEMMPDALEGRADEQICLFMKSTMVIYGHESELTKADAKHIAYLLWAQTTCTRHISEGTLTCIDNLILCLPSPDAEKAESEWREFISTFRGMDLRGKCIAIYMPSGSATTSRMGELHYVLSQGRARIMSRAFVKLQYTIEDWVSAVSPNL